MVMPVFLPVTTLTTTGFGDITLWHGWPAIVSRADHDIGISIIFTPYSNDISPNKVKFWNAQVVFEPP